VPPRNLQGYVGNTYDFKVVKINQERQNIVLSRRELIEQERNERRQKLLAEMTPGDIRKGTVKNITDFGAFIDLNGLDGLLHITELSWTKRIAKPADVLKADQDIEAVVLGINPKSRRFPSASANSKPIRGTRRSRNTRPAPASKAGFATSPATAPSSNWRKVW